MARFCANKGFTRVCAHGGIHVGVFYPGTSSAGPGWAGDALPLPRPLVGGPSWVFGFWFLFFFFFKGKNQVTEQLTCLKGCHSLVILLCYTLVLTVLYK